MGVLYYVLVFYVGAFIGFFLSSWLRSRSNYTGTIYITESEEKTLYSLELNEYPEEIKLHKEVVFKVDASEVDLNRD